MNSGSGAANIPEIDNRTGGQMDDTGFHPAFESFAYRARLDRANGNTTTRSSGSRGRGRRPEPVRPHAPVARHPGRRHEPRPAIGQGASREARRRSSTHASWQVESRATSPATAPGSTTAHRGSPQAAPVPGCDEVPAKPLSRADYGVIAFTDAQWARSGRLPDRRLRLQSSRASASSSRRHGGSPSSTGPAAAAG